jgi:hypothetical protein
MVGAGPWWPNQIGQEESHAAGVKATQQAIDKALAPKKQRLRRPE